MTRAIWATDLDHWHRKFCMYHLMVYFSSLATNNFLMNKNSKLFSFKLSIIEKWKQKIQKQKSLQIIARGFFFVYKSKTAHYFWSNSLARQATESFAARGADESPAHQDFFGRQARNLSTGAPKWEQQSTELFPKLQNYEENSFANI